MGPPMMQALLKIGIYMLEGLFFAGIIGSAIVVIIVTVEDFKEVSVRGNSKEVSEQQRGSQIAAYNS